MNEPDWERQADDLALARYSVISPLVCRRLTPTEKVATRDQILAATHCFPDGTRKVSRRCLDRWCQWYVQGHLGNDGEALSEPGIEALKPIPRMDKGVPRAVDPAVVDRAVELRREDPSRNTSAILDLLKTESARDGSLLTAVKEATLAYHLRQRKATKRDLKRESRVFQRYEQPRRNSTWQGDWSQGFLIPDPSNGNKPRMCHLHAFLDDHSRYIPHAEFYFRQNLPCLEDCFRKAILHGGVPEKVYWDNGAVYHSRQIQMVAARLRTEVIFSTPYAPEGKGKIERWFRTVKEAFYPEARNAGVQSLAELNEFLWGWLDRCYHGRVHSETETSPQARWEAGTARYPEPASLVDLFLWEAKRNVDKSGCIHLAGNLYPVAEHLVGQIVMVRFDPFDLSRVRLYENGQFAQLLEPQTLVSQTFRKATPRKKSANPPRESSAAYKQEIAQNFRRQIKDTLHQARGRQNPASLSPDQFLAVSTECLRPRELTTTEIKWVNDFYLRNAPLIEDLVRTALHTAIEAKGHSRHIRFYLDCIQAARLNDSKGAL